MFLARGTGTSMDIQYGASSQAVLGSHGQKGHFWPLARSARFQISGALHFSLSAQHFARSRTLVNVLTTAVILAKLLEFAPPVILFLPSHFFRLVVSSFFAHGTCTSGNPGNLVPMTTSVILKVISKSLRN